MIQVKKKEGESASALMFKFTKRLRRSGILKEARKRRFRARNPSRLKRRLSAIHKAKKREEIERARKLGTL